MYRTLGLQFGQVRLLVPAHWTDSSYQTVFNLGPENSDILILPQSRQVYTQHIQGCGREALHLRIDSDYVMSEDGSSEGKCLRRALLSSLSAQTPNHMES